MVAQILIKIKELDGEDWFVFQFGWQMTTIIGKLLAASTQGIEVAEVRPNGVLKIEKITMEMLCQAKEKLYGWRGNLKDFVISNQ